MTDHSPVREPPASVEARALLADGVRDVPASVVEGVLAENERLREALNEIATRYTHTKASDIARTALEGGN